MPHWFSNLIKRILIINTIGKLNRGFKICNRKACFYKQIFKLTANLDSIISINFIFYWTDKSYSSEHLVKPLNKSVKLTV